MTRLKAVYRCQQCGFSSAKWLGQCPDCGQWNTLAEERVVKDKRQAIPGVERSGPQPLSDVQPESTKRSSSGLGELDRVLGGGIVPGSVVLIGGDPGIGKSTLLLQVAAAHLSDGGHNHASGFYHDIIENLTGLIERARGDS